MLYCTCGDYFDCDTWYYYHPEDFSKLTTSKRKRCCSCKVLINKQAGCLEFPRQRQPRHDIEEEIYGDEVPLASYFMCEACGEIYLNLSDLGYCLDITQDMREYLKEYQELTGFKGQQ